MDGNQLPVWVTTGIGSIIAALATAVGYMWRASQESWRDRCNNLETQLETFTKKAEKCEEDRQRQAIRLARLEALAGIETLDEDEPEKS